MSEGVACVWCRRATGSTRGGHVRAAHMVRGERGAARGMHGARRARRGRPARRGRVGWGVLRAVRWSRPHKVHRGPGMGRMG